MTEKRKLIALLDRLGGGDEADRVRALGKLRREIKKGITEDNARMVIRAAEGPWQHRIEWRSPDEAILDCFGVGLPARAAPDLIVAFPKLTESGRRSAVRLLAAGGGAEHARCWLELVRRFARSAFVEDVAVAEPTIGSKSAAEVILPEALDYIDVPQIRHHILRAAFCALGDNLVDANLIRPKLQGVVACASELRDHLGQRQERTGVRWMWQEDYAERRFTGSLILDLLGRISGPGVSEELSKWLVMEDPQLLTYAVLSILRTGGEPPEELLRTCAAWPETR
jgi:hypothetical protein